MKKPSTEGRIVQRSIEDIKPPTKAHMRRLLAAANSPVDTSDIPELTAAQIRRMKRGPIFIKGRSKGRVA